MLSHGVSLGMIWMTPFDFLPTKGSVHPFSLEGSFRVQRALKCSYRSRTSQ